MTRINSEEAMLRGEFSRDAIGIYGAGPRSCLERTGQGNGQQLVTRRKLAARRRDGYQGAGAEAAPRWPGV